MDNTINSLVSQSVGVTDQQIKDYLISNPGLDDSKIAKAMETYGVSPSQMARAVGISEGEVAARVAATIPPGQTVTLGDTIVQPQYQTIGSGEDQQIGGIQNVYTYKVGENKTGGGYNQYGADGTLERQGTQQKVDSGLKDFALGAGLLFGGLGGGFESLFGGGAGSAAAADAAGGLLPAYGTQAGYAAGLGMTPAAEAALASQIGGGTSLGTLGALGTDAALGAGIGSGVAGMGAGTGITAAGTGGLGGLGGAVGLEGGLGTGITAAGAGGLGGATGATGLGGLGTGVVGGTGLTGTGVLLGSGLGTDLLGTSLSGLTGTGVLTGSGLGTDLLGTGTGTGLTGTGVLTGSTLGTSLLGTGAGSALTGGVTGLGGTTLGTGALTTGVGSGGGTGGVVGGGTGNMTGGGTGGVTGGGTGGIGGTNLGLGTGLTAAALSNLLGGMSNASAISDARNLINQYGTQAGTALSNAYQNAQGLNAANRTDLGNVYSNLSSNLNNTLNAQAGLYGNTNTNLANNYSNTTSNLQNLYNQQVGYQAPYQQIGSQGAAGLAANQDYLTRQFNANDLNTNLAPNYAFQLQQGQMANQRAANAAGGSLGGNALQGLQKYTQDYAGGAYQQAFNNFNNQRQNIYNSLAGMANIGGTSAGQLAGLGTNYGSNLGSLSSTYGGNMLGNAGQLQGAYNQYGSNLAGAANTYGGNLTTGAGQGINAANVYGLNAANLATGLGSALASNATAGGANTSTALSNLGNTALLGSLIKAT
jgi:hypothetical protein